VEKNAAAGRTPSSLPLSTPPPIASIPSPKFAPSPVHTKSINSKTDCNEDDPFRVQGDSDIRLQSTEQQTDRFQSSGLLLTLSFGIWIFDCMVSKLLIFVFYYWNYLFLHQQGHWMLSGKE
jgi:hypothetical protein